MNHIIPFFRIWDKEKKEYVRFEKLSLLSVGYEDEFIKVKNPKRYEMIETYISLK